MIRLILIIVGVYIGFRILKMMMPGNTIRRKPVSVKHPDAIDDVMIQDPVCRVYFPKRQGVHYRHEGKDFYFCSNRCRDRFLDPKNRLEQLNMDEHSDSKER